MGPKWTPWKMQLPQLVFGIGLPLNWWLLYFRSSQIGVGTLAAELCGCSSVVERHVANVNVGGSNPLTRFPEW